MLVKRNEINEIVNEKDESKLDNALELITRLNASTHNSEITTIDTLSETKVKSTRHLINKMHYPKGKKQGQIKQPNLLTSSIYNNSSETGQRTV